MYEFLIQAFLAGTGFALVAAPLGSLVVWRRMAYFGDTLAHASLLGVALGFVFNFLPLYVSVASVCVLVALLLLLLEKQSHFTRDNLLGILSHTSLALGIVVIALLPGFRADLYGFLFGDILAVSWQDIAVIYLLAAIVLGLLSFNWNNLLAITVHAELATVEGKRINRQQLLFVLLLALSIAMAMKVLGVLLITAMLIIPPATSRPWVKTPEQMVLLALAFSILSVFLGLSASLYLDIPAGPAIVVASALLFSFSWLMSKFQVFK